MKSQVTSSVLLGPREGLAGALLSGILGYGILGTTAPLCAQEQETPTGASTVEFAESAGRGGAPTFRSEAQPVTVQDAMGAVLVTAEEFRLRTVRTDSWLAECQSMRPDLPDARVQPDEIADRVGSLSLAVFDQKQVNFSFRATTDGTEYVLTVDGSQADSVKVTASPSGALVASVTEAPMTVVRNKEESFYCPAAAAFTIKIEP